MNARVTFTAIALALALPVGAGAVTSDQVPRAQTPFKQSPVVRLPALPERAPVVATQTRQTPFKQSPRIDRSGSVEKAVAATTPGAVPRGHIVLKQYPTQRQDVHGSVTTAERG